MDPVVSAVEVSDSDIATGVMTDLPVLFSLISPILNTLFFFCLGGDYTGVVECATLSNRRTVIATDTSSSLGNGILAASLS